MNKKEVKSLTNVINATCNLWLEEMLIKARKEGRKEGQVLAYKEVLESMKGNPKPYASFEACWNGLKFNVEGRLKELEGGSSK